MGFRLSNPRSTSSLLITTHPRPSPPLNPSTLHLPPKPRHASQTSLRWTRKHLPPLPLRSLQLILLFLSTTAFFLFLSSWEYSRFEAHQKHSALSQAIRKGVWEPRDGERRENLLPILVPVCARSSHRLQYFKEVLAGLERMDGANEVSIFFSLCPSSLYLKEKSCLQREELIAALFVGSWKANALGPLHRLSLATALLPPRNDHHSLPLPLLRTLLLLGMVNKLINLAYTEIEMVLDQLGYLYPTCFRIWNGRRRVVGKHEKLDSREESSEDGRVAGDQREGGAWE